MDTVSHPGGETDTSISLVAVSGDRKTPFFSVRTVLHYILYCFVMLWCVFSCSRAWYLWLLAVSMLWLQFLLVIVMFSCLKLFFCVFSLIALPAFDIGLTTFDIALPPFPIVLTPSDVDLPPFLIGLPPFDIAPASFLCRSVSFPGLPPFDMMDHHPFEIGLPPFDIGLSPFDIGIPRFLPNRPPSFPNRPPSF